ncbi:MAG: adenosylcobinamide amidohydrolase [Desulfobacterales bacterium]|nr:MAG: adenosylcobinamide amidohydrolase [Desulfobacterales bacterium]
MNAFHHIKFRRILVLTLIALLGLLTEAESASTIAVQDSLGNRIELTHPPQRIVCLVPSASEILTAIGAEDQLAGATYHDLTLKGADNRGLIGGFFNPSLPHIKRLDPDLIIASPLHQKRLQEAALDEIPVFFYETGRLDDAWTLMTAMGKISGHQDEAAALVKKNKDELAHIRAKLAKAGVTPKRAIRLMGRDSIMTPGNDSFQNDMIRAAGGIAPNFVAPGKIVTVTQAQWMAFDPELIYGCGPDKAAAEQFFSRPGWKDVSAIKTHQIYYLPCELTCRASARVSGVVAYLSSMMYPNEFGDEKNFVHPVSQISQRPLDLATLKGESKAPVVLPDYVKSATMVHSHIFDFQNKTLVIDLKPPMTVVSTLEGQRDNITTVGNHYSPPPTWLPGHSRGIEDIRRAVLRAIGREKDHTAFLMTGADMDDLCVNTFSFKEMQVTALVTAGVVSNAMRMGEDTGLWYEPGTINILILTNMKLSARAMTRAIITATEAKSAALQDLDIRSAYTGKTNLATGTGTDNILVVQGTGPPIDNTGGHSKMGELIAKAVNAGVRSAIKRQNGLVSRRHVFQRLEDRNISVYQLVSGAQCDCQGANNAMSAMVEQLLLSSEYSGFLQAALSLSDAWERGQISDLTSFDLWCGQVAAKIAGQDCVRVKALITDDTVPLVIRKALDAIMTGARIRMGDTIDEYSEKK